MRFTLLITSLLLVAGCSTSPSPTSPEQNVVLARPDDASISARVADATARLDSTEAGRMVLASINAHGGLERWYSNGPIHFRYRYEQIGEDEPLETDQAIDTWSSRARHTMVSDTTVSFGWTGQEAWVKPDTTDFDLNARFFSLTPYYFVAMPFVLADPGVNLEMAGQMTSDSTTYDLVRVTFDAGTGDAPNDYYYVLIDPETRQTHGVRYVVSYPGFFPEGGSTPESLMLYDGEQSVEGIVLQEGFRSFAWTAEGAGEPKARGSLTHVRFEPMMPDSAFAMPVGAAVQEEM